jgi:hypothetical protein
VEWGGFGGGSEGQFLNRCDMCRRNVNEILGVGCERISPSIRNVTQVGIYSVANRYGRPYLTTLGRFVTNETLNFNGEPPQRRRDHHIIPFINPPWIQQAPSPQPDAVEHPLTIEQRIDIGEDELLPYVIIALKIKHFQFVR